MDTRRGSIVNITVIHAFIYCSEVNYYDMMIKCYNPISEAVIVISDLKYCLLK